MPETPNQVSSGQRRANWVALRAFHQLPKAVGETADGEAIYEVRSVPLLLDGPAGNFVRLTECSRCGNQLAGAPVLTAADLDRPLRPMICTDCIRSAGVSTVWEPEGAAAAARPAPTTLAAAHPEPATEAPVEAQQPDRLRVMEGHLRAVTDRVNELGRVARAHQADLKERTRREEAAAAALAGELAALRASSEEIRGELGRLAEAQASVDRLAEAPAGVEGSPEEGEAGAGLAQLRHEVAQLARLVEAQRGEVIGFIAAVGETQLATTRLAAAQEARAGTLAGFDPSKLEELIATRLAEAEGRLAEAAAGARAGVDLTTVDGLVATRLAEAEGRLAEAAAGAPAGVDLTTVEKLIATSVADAEGRLADRITGHWRDLETTIDGTVTASTAGVVRAIEELAGGQAALEERVDTLSDRLNEASRRVEALLDRLAAVEWATHPVPAQPAEAAAKDGPAGSFLDSLDRQLDAAARRLAARSQAGAGRGEP